MKFCHISQSRSTCRRPRSKWLSSDKGLQVVEIVADSLGVQRVVDQNHQLEGPIVPLRRSHLRYAEKAFALFYTFTFLALSAGSDFSVRSAMSVMTICT